MAGIIGALYRLLMSSRASDSAIHRDFRRLKGVRGDSVTWTVKNLNAQLFLGNVDAFSDVRLDSQQIIGPETRFSAAQ